MQPLDLKLPLNGSRTNVRSFRPNDVAQFQKYRADPVVARYQDWAPMTEDQALEFLLEMSAAEGPVPGKWIQLGIVLPATDALIGDIGLFLEGNGGAAEIGFTLARQYQGQGYATEAVSLVVEAVFASTGARKVRAITDARNSASIRLLGRVDFVKVSEHQATLRGEACTDYVFERSTATT